MTARYSGKLPTTERVTPHQFRPGCTVTRKRRIRRYTVLALWLPQKREKYITPTSHILNKLCEA